MSSRIEDLAPDAQPVMRMFINNLEAQGIKGFIPPNGISTSRTHWEQFVTWLQGRADPAVVAVARQHAGFAPINTHDAGTIVTKADGKNSLSNHQSGRAIDWVPFRADGTPLWWPVTTDEISVYRRVGAVAKACGILCGMDWDQGFIDWDHFELPPAAPGSLGVAGSTK